MPFKSQKQRAYMYARHPDIAERWRKESGPQRGLPERAKSKKKTRHGRHGRDDRRQQLVRQFLKRQSNA